MKIYIDDYSRVGYTKLCIRHASGMSWYISVLGMGWPIKIYYPSDYLYENVYDEIVVLDRIYDVMNNKPISI